VSTGGRQKRRKQRTEGDDGSEDEKLVSVTLSARTASMKTWAVDFLNTGYVFSSSMPLDVRNFMDPQLPVRVRLLNSKRVEKILTYFNKMVMSPAKLLFIDVGDDGNVLPNLKWRRYTSQASFTTFFNSATQEEIIQDLGEPWVIGGYHSSKALAEYSLTHPETDTLRPTFVFRLSEVACDMASDETTKLERMQLSRYLSTVDNTSSQETEGYEAQSPLTLVYLWKELYDQVGRPFMRSAGKHTPEFALFRQQCVAGAEHLEKLLDTSGIASLTPLLKVATLPSDPAEDPNTFQKMFRILCSFDDRDEAAGLPLERFHYIKIAPPLSEQEEKAGKKWKGRIMKIEDLKEITRMPYHDRLHFIDLVHDTDYVLESMGRDPEDSELSPTVRSICKFLLLFHLYFFYFCFFQTSPLHIC